MCSIDLYRMWCSKCVFSTHACGYNKTCVKNEVNLHWIHPCCSCRGKVLSRRWPFQHYTLKVDLLLISQFTLYFSPHSWQLDIGRYMALIDFFQLLSFSTSLSILQLPSHPIHRGGRVIRMWAVVSSPNHFYMLGRINPPVTYAN